MRKIKTLMKHFIQTCIQAFQRCKKFCISIFIVYLISCLTGSIMVHSGNTFALSFRDKIVGRAIVNDKASTNYNSGNKFKATLIDFSGNLLLGSTVQTVLGISVAIPYFSTFFQGWVGGIVTVDGTHKSRFSNRKSTSYYLIVFILQTLAYSLCIGSGIKLGVETYRLNKTTSVLKYRLHKQSLKDILLIYVLAIPIFFVASCFEFLSSWN